MNFILGPSIPDNMRKVLAEKEREVIKYESSDEDVGIGPLPVGSEEKWSDAHRRLEERALDIKIKNLDGPSDPSNVKSREKWMLELPEGKAKILGLEARSFRAKAGPDMSDRLVFNYNNIVINIAKNLQSIRQKKDTTFRRHVRCHRHPT